MYNRAFNCIIKSVAFEWWSSTQDFTVLSSSCYWRNFTILIRNNCTVNTNTKRQAIHSCIINVCKYVCVCCVLKICITAPLKVRFSDQTCLFTAVLGITLLNLLWCEYEKFCQITDFISKGHLKDLILFQFSFFFFGAKRKK